MSDWYRLEGRAVVGPVDFPETGVHHVGRDTLHGSDVSTVFLGLDHSWGEGGPPIVFETMIFGGVNDQYQERYATYDEAEVGHARALWLVGIGAAAAFVDVQEVR